MGVHVVVGAGPGAGPGAGAGSPAGVAQANKTVTVINMNTERVSSDQVGRLMF